MSAIIPFLFEGERLFRSIEIDGEPWFVAVDACRVLGIKNARDALSALDPDEIRQIDLRLVNTVGSSDGIPVRGNPTANIISEGGLYTVMLRCRAATTPGTMAHRFRRWVLDEVIPAIRKTGAYAPAAATVEMGDEMPESARLRMVTETRQSFGIAAAQQMWFEMKLPVVPAMLAARDQADLFQSGERGNQH